MNVSIQNITRDEVLEVIRGLDDFEQAKMMYMTRISQYVFQGSVDGELVCVWGLVSPSILSDQAYLWLHCTPTIDGHRFLFIRHSQRWIENALNEYKVIVGYCQDKNERAKRWIEWLGATFDEADVAGRRKFTITRKLHG